jgi:FkbM family methyltransferase
MKTAATPMQEANPNEMNPVLKKALRRLPTPISSKLRFLRDQIAIRTFRPKIVEHNYGGIPLVVSLADSMSAQWYDHDWAELPEIKFLKTVRPWEGARIFDLGAHQGVVALTLARTVGSSGQVIAVEGGRRNFELASENKRLNEADNLIVLHSVVDSTDGSSVSFSSEINGSVSASGSPVTSRSIDALTSQYGAPDLVMLDIEGYECHALAGATETLKTCANWCIEVHAGCGLESFGGSAEQVVQIFKDGGYNLYCYAEDETEVHSLSAIPPGRFFLIATRN